MLGGVCLVATEIDEAGDIRQLADFQSLSFGEIDGARTARIEAVDANLHGARFDTSISEHILKDMWQKWVQLATLGAINCLLGGNIGQIGAVPGVPICALQFFTNAPRSPRLADNRRPTNFWCSKEPL